MTKAVNVLECVYWISSSWHETKISTIETCFLEAGFPAENPDSAECPDDDDAYDDIPLAQLARIAQRELSDVTDIEESLETEETFGENWEKHLWTSLKKT